ncbi:ABC transporter permease subunit/CPBP intramembrane protease [Longimicrobium sp.]|uniref:ABC transporter permease subunit/CPBP intramembrane protease n=1 Tax=Longimicrobium sp. TaxID=2029185 RepID=UPI002E37E972|nr:ABC transporter permease subunit/CPBP intramembrane protease [Longimicrobium sp.]HEX6039140.1 ABC transporter permease subunit/CPBP intramembrane protease [Longimicrobium sp.]
MRWNTVRTVLAKELRETVRDRRTLFMMLVLPTLLYPAILVLVQQLAIFGQKQLSAAPAKVAVAGADPALVRFLDADSAIRVFGSANATVAAVREGKVEAAVLLGPAPTDLASAGSASTQSATAGAGAQRPDTFALSHARTLALPDAGTREARILFDGSDDRSQRAQGLARARLEAWNDTLLARRLQSAQLPSTFATPLAVADTSVATAEEAGGYALGRFLPLILVMMTLLGTFYPAIDLAAGEKERGTLETLLTAPVPAAEIVAGKFTAVALIGLAAAVANLASMLLTFQSGLFRFGQAAQIRFTLPPAAALLIFAALIPLAVLFAATCLGLAVRAQSFKEAQNALTPVQLGATLPLFIVSMPGIDFTPALAVVPVVGVGMFFRELMAGGAPLLPSVLAILSTVVYAGLALAFAARAFGREEVLFGGGSGDVAPKDGGWADRLRGWRAAERGVPLPAEAMVFIAFIGLLYFHLGARLQRDHVERGLVISQYLLLALPAIAFAVRGPYDARKALAIRPPRPRALLAAALIALGGIPVGWLIGWLQLQLWEGGAEALMPLQNLLTATDAQRALWLLFIAAITPALCEELVFRGILLQSLSREEKAWRAVLLSAAIFGGFHLSFETALRFLPTMWIGLLMGWVVWHSRSIFASMLMHFLNNAFVVVLLWQPSVQRFAFRGEELAWPTVIGGAALLVLGLRLLPRRDVPPISSSVPLATGEP